MNFLQTISGKVVLYSVVVGMFWQYSDVAASAAATALFLILLIEVIDKALS